MKLIILDRDGVINEDSPHYIKTPDEWHAIPGSLEAIAACQQAGFTFSIATNQSGIGRGLYTEATLAMIHQKMQQQLAQVGGSIDSIFYCPHIPDDNCFCRKPKPGLLEQLQQHYQCSLHNIPFIGDSQRDLDAAIQGGAQPILVRTGNGQKTCEQYKTTCSFPVFDNLQAALQAIMQGLLDD